MSKKMNRIVAVLLCLVLCSLKSISVNAASNVTKSQVMDAETLIQMAEAGIDEFAEDTGIQFHVDSEQQFQRMNSLMRTGTVQDAEDYVINTYRTSQCLGTVLNENGDYDKIYALNGVVTYSDSNPSDTKSNGGCTIKTTLYIQWGTGNKIEFKLLKSSASITGTLRPTSLKMENCVYEGWGYDNHYNTQTISYPSNTTYNLYPSYSGYISQYSAYCGAEDTVSFGDGGTLKTSIFFDA